MSTYINLLKLNPNKMKKINTATSIITFLGIIGFAALKNSFEILAIAFYTNFMILHYTLNNKIKPESKIRIFNFDIPLIIIKIIITTIILVLFLINFFYKHIFNWLIM
jgi:hypothetical protein